ncbi:MAG: pSer/pThr/pTyr-binding forkhead associated (FHA) protein, partial [Candidatus Azotimanducaceae bacterium]
MDSDKTVIYTKGWKEKWFIQSRDTSSAAESMRIHDGFKVGRGAACDLVLAEDLASRHHATFFLENDVLIVEDNGSTNGTFVNDVMVNRIELKSGDVIYFDQMCFEIRDTENELATPKFKSAAKQEDDA